jgi:hypothetical protein
MAEKSTPQSTATRHVRIAEDLAEMLGDILETEGGTSAAFLDPLLRAEIVKRHNRNMPAITALQKARDKARKLREQGPVAAHELGGEGG